VCSIACNIKFYLTWICGYLSVEKILYCWDTEEISIVEVCQNCMYHYYGVTHNKHFIGVWKILGLSLNVKFTNEFEDVVYTEHKSGRGIMHGREFIFLSSIKLGIDIYSCTCTSIRNLDTCSKVWILIIIQRPFSSIVLFLILEIFRLPIVLLKMFRIQDLVVEIKMAKMIITLILWYKKSLIIGNWYEKHFCC